MHLDCHVLNASYTSYLNQVTQAGLLIPLGVNGLYGLSGVFEDVIERFERLGDSTRGTLQGRSDAVSRDYEPARLPEDDSY